jgi:hypothetical protein
VGLDASIGCACHARGLTSPSPVPLQVDADGEVTPVSNDDWRAFRAWRESCCPHQGMVLMTRRIGNWASYRSFQEALGAAGWAHFPTLERTLPEANGGETSAGDARACVDELARFRTIYREARPALIDSDTGELIYDYIAAYKGLFVFAGRAAGYNVGFDRDGLYAATDAGQLLFRALRVELRQAEPGRTRFICRDTGLSWSGGVNIGEHARVEVVERIYGPDEHAHVLEALDAVFRVAAEHDRPVSWC